MKTRITLFLLSLGLLAGSVQAQPPRIVVQGTGAPQVFSTINAALAAAQPNDKLYLSGGVFNSAASIAISMPLHFIGAGHAPDSTAATGISQITTTAGNIILTTAASGSTFTGIIFSPAANVQFGTSATDDDPTGIVFARCTFTRPVGLAFSGTGAASSTDFKECVFFNALNGAGSATATVDHCIFDFQLGTGAEVIGFAGGGLTLRHCVGMGTRVGNSPGCTIENSIFTRTNAPFWQSNGAILRNNLLVSAALTSNMTAGGASTGNVLGVAQSSIFINELDDNFTWADDLHLQATSVGVNMATDGGDVGLYGGSPVLKTGAVPYNPHVSSATVAPSTNVNSALPVNITVIAQPN